MSAPRLSMAEFDYELSLSSIAHVAAEPRDSARLLVDGGPCRAPEHRNIADLPSLLGPGDLLVVNETRVMPARLPLRKRTGGAAEVLLLEPLGTRPSGSWGWAALVRPSRRIVDGAVLVSDLDASVQVVVGPRLDDQRRAVSVLVNGAPLTDVSQARLLRRAGEAPLPPYIDPSAARAAMARRLGLDAVDSDATQTALADRYQTVYARSDGSAAAPTAGLHLTERLLDALRAKGVGIATVDLTVGLATFSPVTAEHADDHQMHAEHYRVPAETLAACALAERVIAVGTTTVRALESAARQQRPPLSAPPVDGVCGSTDLFLRRGAEFLMVDAMLTNFHLPRSSLLLLIDAFIGPRWRSLYRTALAEGYRFLSFGDAMLLHRTSPS